MVAEDDETSKDNEIDKLMALISLSLKRIYKPTNNNLRTSSNTSRANQDISPRINKSTGFENQRIGNVAGARETVAYQREKMLLCKQEEAGIQLNAEQADWRDDTDDELEDQELEAHYMYMAQLQEVSLDAASSGPIFDTEPVQKVSTNDHYNVFAIESKHPKQPKSIHDTYSIEQDEHNVITDSLDMSYDREQIDQNDDDADLVNERELLASLIEKLKCEIDDNKNRNKFLETSNKILIEKLKGEIEDFKNKNKSLKSSNNRFKEANNKLSETNNLLYNDFKKSQAELARRNSVEYASKDTDFNLTAFVDADHAGCQDSRKMPTTTTIFAATTPENTPLGYRASTSTNPNYVISPAFVEANYETLESLLRDQRRQMRNNNLRTELEYFSKNYNEEREMKPRPKPTKAITPPLRAASPKVHRRRERVVRFEETQYVGESWVKKKAKVEGLRKKLQEGMEVKVHGLPFANSNEKPPIEGSFENLPQGGHVPSTFTNGNILPKNRPNGKLIHNSIINVPYVRRMILEPCDPNRKVLVNETFHVQTDDKLTDKELKQIEADDQVIQIFLLGLPEDIYAAVDSCETAQEIWLHVQQMMKGSDIGIQEKKAKLFNEWERFTSTDGESIESYYHHFLKLMNDLKRNKHFPEKIASNLKFLNNLQP
nr:Gag-Pol polyprotein [Tanacetum cinerariifolium]